MDIYHGGFAREELTVILDALSYYIDCRNERKLSLIKRQERSEARLDWLVIQTQMDESVKDQRDMAAYLDNLIKRMLENFEHFNQLAYSLYEKILKDMEKVEC